MIKYSTKEIIERAEQLADLQNSDFVSPEEKQFLLNEAWMQIYQNVINSNDKVWLKTVYINGSTKLPKDFYQLASLYTTSGKEQILKKNNASSSGYEYRNNSLILSQDYEGVDITLEYYPTPETLFYKSDKKHPADFATDVLQYIDESIYYGTDNVLYVNDEATDITLNTVSGQGILTLHNGYMTVVYEQATEPTLSTRLRVARYNNDGSLAETRSYNTVDSENNPELFVIQDNEISWNGLTIDKSMIPNSCFAFVTDKTEEQMYFLCFSPQRGMILYSKDGKVISYLGFSLSNILCRQDGVYNISSSGNIDRYNGTVKETFKETIYKPIAFIDDHTAIYKFADKYYEGGFGFNTLLDYPNNIYFIALAYSLAISFKMKQNGDAANLVSKYNEVMAQLYDAVTRDANDVYQVKDAYSNNSISIWR